MNTQLLIAGVLCFILGLSHSILGELLIFRKKKEHRYSAPTILLGKHLGIIWATWHLASFLGWSLGSILIKIALQQNLLINQLLKFIAISVTISMLASSLLVAIGTKGKHPGWFVLLAIGILTLINI